MQASEAQRAATEADSSSQRGGVVLRFLVAGIVLALWFWTQSLIGARTAPVSGIGDAIHNLTAGLNTYFAQNKVAANALLILSSAPIDALGLFLLGRWLSVAPSAHSSGCSCLWPSAS
jgi:hypothetical protein